MTAPKPKSLREAVAAYIEAARVESGQAIAFDAMRDALERDTKERAKERERIRFEIQAALDIVTASRAVYGGEDDAEAIRSRLRAARKLLTPEKE